MTDLSKRFEQVIKSALKKYPFFPQKTQEGILLGDVLIKSQSNLKYIYKKDQLIYKEVSLNSAAIKLAECLAENVKHQYMDELYRADQEYSKWYIDSQIMRSSYEKSVKKQDAVKSDIYWTRYQESKNLALTYKNRVEQIILNLINIR
jgi:hypothetical protein